MSFFVILKDYYYYLENLFYDKTNLFFKKICFYRYPTFHNYLALLYFITGLHTVLYFCKITPVNFVIQLGLLSSVYGCFWYDVLQEFLFDAPSKRISYEVLEDVIVLFFDLIDTDDNDLDIFIFLVNLVTNGPFN